MATTYLNRTPSSEGNRKKWTFSTWFKIENITDGAIFTAGASGQDEMTIRLEESGGNFNIDWQIYKVSNSTTIGRLITNRSFRDTSAWYHLVCRYDSTNSTAGDRMRMYINGVEETSFSTDTNPTLNYDAMVNNTVIHNIGRQSWNNSGYFDGYLSQTILADGQSYAPTVFGSTNAQGIWVPITSPSVTYGTNGFKLDYAGTGASADANGFGADSSGQTNHYASNNLGTNPNTTDTPANNFATLNVNDQWNSHTPQESVRGVLSKSGRNFSSNGPLGGSERYYNITGTIAVPSAGKWYWEAKPIAGSNGLGFRWSMGLFRLDRKYSTNSLREYDNSQGQVGTYTADGKVSANGSTVATYETLAVNDIISFKYDADNRDLYIAKNGTYFNSGNAVLTSSNISDTGQKLVVLQNGSDGNVASQVNFGQPPYTIASGNSDGNGYGNFEYAVPTGYYALCSKNVGLYGG